MTKFSTLQFQSFVQQYQFLEQLPNVQMNFNAVKDQNTHPLEQQYLHHIFQHLQSYANFNRYQFYILSANAEWNVELDEHSIVFYMSNEDHQIPASVQKAFAVFSPYCPTVNCPRNVFPIPLGYNGAIPEKRIKDVMDRKLDLFFSGNLHRKRLPFYLAIQKMKLLEQLGGKNHKHAIHFSRQFTGGLGPEEYANLLMETKIALVPSGYLSKNSFRFFEALRYGCIVMTEKLYDYWFYKAFPGIQLKYWWNMHKQLNALLNSPILMEHMQGQSLRYYEDYCSEKVVASYVVAHLERLECLHP
jgi:hypothetical protein